MLGKKRCKVEKTRRLTAAETSCEAIDSDGVGITHIGGLLKVLGGSLLHHWWVGSSVRRLGLLCRCNMLLVDLALHL